MHAYDRFRRLLADEPLPAALVDLDALEHNLAVLLDRLGQPVGPGGAPVTLRVATKSVRCLEILRLIGARGGPRLRGLMCYSAREAGFLADQGFDDLLIAYPVARADEAAAVAELTARGVTVRAMVDHPAQVALLAREARAHGVEIRLCLDVDVSWRPAEGLSGGRVHLGVRRSPIRHADDAVRLARTVADGVRLDAVMAYEAQVAGLPDRPAGQRYLAPALRLVKERGRALAAARRAEVVGALRDAGHDIALVNGGGTGSVRSTAHDGTVTEVAAGSGFYCPHLFDGYADLPLRPAAFFALSVVRSSDAGIVTCAGGGYPASGAAGSDRLPIVAHPEGARPLDLEGWGEVQTPLRCTGYVPSLGEPVICRHAKAGELAERFESFLLIRGDEIVDRVPTYRGQGRCFL